MYWRQIVAAAILGAAVGVGATRLGQSLVGATGLALVVYVLVRVAFATRARIHDWLGRTGHDLTTGDCGSCGQYIRRQPGDWITECKRCGTRAGFPGLRWLIHSVPAIHFRRSFGWVRVTVIVIAMAIVVMNPTTIGSVGAPIPVLDDGIGADPESNGAATVGSEQTTPEPELPSQETDGTRTAAGLGTKAVFEETTPTVTPSPTPRPDRDGDGLDDVTERELGTDPTDRDTDGDRLDDYEEYNNLTRQGYPLPNASATHKDIYLTLLVTANVENFSADERRSLRDLWEGMPVSNPDDEPGIRLHINQSRVGRETSDATIDSVDSLRKQYYSPEFIPRRAQCVRHVGLVLAITSDEYGGRGDAPGYFFIADGGSTEARNTAYTVRTVMITHELLHNIIGTFADGSIHTDDGWLYHGGGVFGEHFGMNDRTRRHLTDNGFDESEYYRKAVC